MAGADAADLLYLHHLSPLNEAAAREFPEIPVLGHVHGTELLMLERIAAGAPASWTHAESWALRICDWAADCERLVVSGPRGRRRAAAVLDLDPDRFVCAPNGFDPGFAPREVDRRSHWRRHLVERPQGWRPGKGPGSVAYAEADLEPLDGTVLLYSGRFTEVKRLPLLIEAYARARRRFSDSTALVLLGGYPGEWEGEHPIETVERLGLKDVFLAGWHSHEELPEFINASDLLVHASVKEQFGQVLVEAMACGLPAIAIDRDGPADDRRRSRYRLAASSRRRRRHGRGDGGGRQRRRRPAGARPQGPRGGGRPLLLAADRPRPRRVGERAAGGPELTEVQRRTGPGREGPCRKS